jgi:cold shock CspA family protein
VGDHRPGVTLAIGSVTIRVVAAGEITWWDADKGYGLVVFDGGGQGGMSSTGLKGTTRPRQGLRVEFVTARNRWGFERSYARVVEEPVEPTGHRGDEPVT